MATIDWKITREIAGRAPVEETDRIVVEAPLEVRVNGMPLVALMRLPGADKELAAGFCLTERIITSAASINIIRHCGQMAALQAEGLPRPENAPAQDRGDVVEMEVAEAGNTGRFKETFVVRTGCGGADLSAVGKDIEGLVRSDLRVERAVLLGLAERLTAEQPIFNSTGGTHGAGLFTAAGDLIVVMEDVGRHNALDKVVGYAALRSIPVEDKVLVLSGRVSYEMVTKAARVGIPVVASLAAPTGLGLAMAEKAGCTVIGFLGARRFNIYTYPERVTD